MRDKACLRNWTDVWPERHGEAEAVARELLKAAAFFRKLAPVTGEGCMRAMHGEPNLARDFTTFSILVVEFSL